MGYWEFIEEYNTNKAFVEFNGGQRIGKTFGNFYLQMCKILNDDIGYILRCLDKINYPFDPNALTIVEDVHHHTYCVIYPYNYEKHLNDINPMFCLGIVLKETDLYGEYFFDIIEVNNIDELRALL